jgi:hypothetical protein
MKKPSQIGLAVAAVLVAAGLAFTLLRPGTTEVTIDDGPPVTASDEGSPVVAGLRAAGGFSLFGLRIVDPTHTVEVRFTAGPDCAALLSSGDPWPVPDPECAVPVPVAGEVASLGVTSTGRSLVGVRFPVSRACYESLALGTPWPPESPDCSETNAG